jgi:hypothetical protein
LFFSSFSVLFSGRTRIDTWIQPSDPRRDVDDLIVAGWLPDDPLLLLLPLLSLLLDRDDDDDDDELLPLFDERLLLRSDDEPSDFSSGGASPRLPREDDIGRSGTWRSSSLFYK